MSKTRLEFDDDYEFTVLGISCHLRDYRVAWLIDQKLNRRFNRHSLPVRVEDGSIVNFATYRSHDSNNHLRYVLVSNHGDQFSFHKRLRQYDYFIFVEGYLTLFDHEGFKKTLTEIESIQLIGSIDPTEFQKMQYVLFEE